MKRASLVLFLVVSLLCLGCDQLTKEMARSHLRGAGSASLAFGTLQLGLAENPGAFLSVGASWPEGVRKLAFLLGVPLILLLVCAFTLRQPGLTTRELSGLALVVGGGGGNWLDRLLRDGAVTDFVRIDLGLVQTGVFNAADVAILGGVLLLVLGSRARPEAPAASAG